MRRHGGADGLEVARAGLPHDGVALVGQPGSCVEVEARREGVPFWAEGFPERGYRDDGRLVPRGEPGAVLDDPDAIAAVRARVEAIVAAEGAIGMARLRDELGTSRKYAQALLEHLDAARVTLRLPDDRRVLRRRGGT